MFELDDAALVMGRGEEQSDSKRFDRHSAAPGVSCRVLHGDCLARLKDLPAESVNLVMTSPPYADKRRSTYGGVAPEAYVDWFLPRSAEFMRVLRGDGSFILNIKEGVYDGERHPYVYDLTAALRKQGWKLIDDYIWAKRNAFPGRWPNRLRDAWEHCFHFARGTRIRMFQDEVRVPIGEWARRASRPSLGDDRRQESATKSGFGRRRSAWVGKQFVLPSNVIHLPTESTNRGHSAVYPVGLPDWFIRLFTLPGDVVLDPFAGSGTTGVACKLLGRHFIGVEAVAEYCALVRKRWDAAELRNDPSAGDDAA